LRYFDTSVIFSLYINEARTPSVDAELRKNPADVIISPWVDIELKSALSLGVRSGRLGLQDAQTALSNYRSDRAQGQYNLQVIDTKHFMAAEQQIAFNNTLRAGDSLHLGIALVENHLLVTGDDDLAQLAQALGVVTVHIL
jgi:predicted nucleic acid-binding protein